MNVLADTGIQRGKFWWYVRLISCSGTFTQWAFCCKPKNTFHKKAVQSTAKSLCVYSTLTVPPYTKFSFCVMFIILDLLSFIERKLKIIDLYWIWKCLLQFQLSKKRVTVHVFFHSSLNLHERKNMKMIMKLKRSRTIYTTVLISVLSRFKIHVMLLSKNIKFSK